jgi:hypothetical protein
VALPEILLSPIAERAQRPSVLAPASPQADGRLRRCTFRRVTLAAPVPARGRAVAMYEVMCLFPACDTIPLGDLVSARAICDACTASGIFRPDED